LEEYNMTGDEMQMQIQCVKGEERSFWKAVYIPVLCGSIPLSAVTDKKLFWKFHTAQTHCLLWERS
jgi:uncharacterized protein (DUF2062 family)